MFIQETPNPDAEILITRGDASEEGAVLVGVIPFEFSARMGADDYEQVIAIYNQLAQIYEKAPDEYINLQLRFNRDYVNI